VRGAGTKLRVVIIQPKRRSKMIVYVAFKFDEVDPDSPEADQIVAEITESCETMRIGFDANACWVEDAVLSTKEEK
jgi:hypothetical protein